MAGKRRAQRPTGGNAKAGNAFKMYMESDTLSPKIKALPKFVDGIVKTTMRYYEPQVENHARMYAPWTDQSTNARNGLVARSGVEGKGVHYIVLAHQVPYGIWLEIRWSGKYAIIMPTVDLYGPKVLDTLQKILDRY